MKKPIKKKRVKLVKKVEQKEAAKPVSAIGAAVFSILVSAFDDLVKQSPGWVCSKDEVNDSADSYKGIFRTPFEVISVDIRRTENGDFYWQYQFDIRPAQRVFTFSSSTVSGLSSNDLAAGDGLEVCMRFPEDARHGFLVSKIVTSIPELKKTCEESRRRAMNRFVEPIEDRSLDSTRAFP